MGLYQRNEIYWVKIRRNNYHCNVSTHCTDRKEAEKVLASKLMEAAASKHPILRSSIEIPFHKIAWDYYNKHSKLRKKSEHMDAYYIRLFCEMFTGKNLSQITVYDVEGYIDWRVNPRKDENDEPLKPVKMSTVHRELRTLAAIFTWAKKHDQFFGESPLKKIKRFKESRGRLRFLSKDEFRRLLTVVSPKLQDLILFAVSTGFRKGEIKQLSMKEHVDFENRTIFVPDRKGGDSEYFEMNSLAYEVLKRQTEDRPFNYEFRRAFETAARRSGFVDVVFHTLRHTFASWLAISGESLYKIQRMMGHKTSKMTEKYAHLCPLSQSQGAEKIVTFLGTENKKALSNAQV